MNPKIVFSTPIYSNKRHPRFFYCLELIESVDHQLAKDSYLYVIINDGSTDKTKSILEEVAKNNQNLIIINQVRKGGTYAFNLGIDISINPQKHRLLLGEENYKKIIKLNPDLVSFIGVDDLVGPELEKELIEIGKYSPNTKLFLGNYRSFLNDTPYSRRELTPYHKNLKKFFRLLFFVENFPSHVLIFKKEFIQEIKKFRQSKLGIIDPKILSPQAYELMLLTTKLAIIRGYQFALLKENMGYKRYGIKGTMTEKNKKSGRYFRERKLVFQRYIQFARENRIANFKKRPPLKNRYFKPLRENDKVAFDKYLSKIISLTRKKYYDIC